MCRVCKYKYASTYGSMQKNVQNDDAGEFVTENTYDIVQENIGMYRRRCVGCVDVNTLSCRRICRTMMQENL